MSRSSWQTKKYAIWPKSPKTSFKLLKVYYKHTCSGATFSMHTRTTKFKKNVKSLVWDDDLAHFLQCWSIFSRFLDWKFFLLEQKFYLVLLLLKTLLAYSKLNIWKPEQNQEFGGGVWCIWVWNDKLSGFHVLPLCGMCQYVLEKYFSRVSTGFLSFHNFSNFKTSSLILLFFKVFKSVFFINFFIFAASWRCLACVS